MKRLLVVIVVAAALWSGYWVMASRSAKAGFETWFEARRAEGWQAEYSALSVSGFPNRVDTTFENIALADPESGLAWQAEFFKLFALTYQPNHLIAVWPTNQLISTPETKYTLSAADMRASFVTDNGPSRPLDRANLVAEAIAVEGPKGATTLEGLQAAVTREAGDPRAYRIAVNADGLAPPLPGGLELRTGGQLPRTLSSLRADMSVEFEKPWDLDAISVARPQPRMLHLRLAEAKWGQLELALAGKLDIDEDGRPRGRIVLKARNWRDIIGLLRAMEMVPAEWLDPVEQALGLAAQLSGNRQTLDLPIEFDGRTMSLGPVPIGPAPVIKLR